VEIAVVTVTGIDLPPREFATGLFNRWGIGKAGADSGLLVLIVADQRRIEMETGYGLEPALPDGWLSALQHETMLPAFRSGDHGAGVEAGLAAPRAWVCWRASRCSCAPPAAASAPAARARSRCACWTRCKTTPTSTPARSGARDRDLPPLPPPPQLPPQHRPADPLLEQFLRRPLRRRFLRRRPLRRWRRRLKLVSAATRARAFG
jgi:TPM domain